MKNVAPSLINIKFFEPKNANFCWNSPVPRLWSLRGGSVVRLYIGPFEAQSCALLTVPLSLENQYIFCKISSEWNIIAFLVFRLRMCCEAYFRLWVKFGKKYHKKDRVKIDREGKHVTKHQLKVANEKNGSFQKSDWWQIGTSKCGKHEHYFPKIKIHEPSNAELLSPLRRNLVEKIRTFVYFFECLFYMWDSKNNNQLGFEKNKVLK